MKASIPGEEAIRLHQGMGRNEKVGCEALAWTSGPAVRTPSDSGGSSRHDVDRFICHRNPAKCRPGDVLIGECSDDLRPYDVAGNQCPLGEAASQRGE